MFSTFALLLVLFMYAGSSLSEPATGNHKDTLHIGDSQTASSSSAPSHEANDLDTRATSSVNHHHQLGSHASRPNAAAKRHDNGTSLSSPQDTLALSLHPAVKSNDAQASSATTNKLGTHNNKTTTQSVSQQQQQLPAVAAVGAAAAGHKFSYKPGGANKATTDPASAAIHSPKNSTEATTDVRHKDSDRGKTNKQPVTSVAASTLTNHNAAAAESARPTNFSTPLEGMKRNV